MVLHIYSEVFYNIISGSCVDAGYVGCCEDEGCHITADNTSCYCDANCYRKIDCCYDISLLNCTETISKCNYVVGIKIQGCYQQ